MFLCNSFDNDSKLKNWRKHPCLFESLVEKPCETRNHKMKHKHLYSKYCSEHYVTGRFHRRIFAMCFSCFSCFFQWDTALSASIKYPLMVPLTQENSFWNFCMCQVLNTLQDPLPNPSWIGQHLKAGGGKNSWCKQMVQLEAARPRIGLDVAQQNNQSSTENKSQKIWAHSLKQRGWHQKQSDCPHVWTISLMATNMNDMQTNLHLQKFWLPLADYHNRPKITMFLQCTRHNIVNIYFSVSA